MEVRGANTFPLLNRLPNLNLVAMTILSVFFSSVGFIDIFPFLLGINKVRWRLCCTSNARERVESHFYRYRKWRLCWGQPKRVNPSLVFLVLLLALFICLFIAFIIGFLILWLEYLDFWHFVDKALHPSSRNT